MSDKVNRRLSELSKEVSLHLLFSPENSLTFSDSTRHYLDETPLKGVELFLSLLDLISQEITDKIEGEVVVCIRHWCDITYEESRTKVIEDFAKFNLKNDGFSNWRLTEVPNHNDHFFFLHFTPIDRSQLKVLLWAHLAKFFSFLEDCLHGEVYLFSFESRILFSIYDDRGMDVIRW